VILDKAQVPLYVQLADLFRQRIARGVWREGEMLPSLEKLVAEFGVARVTVRQAIERLTRDGLVSPQRGRGTFVTGAPRTDRWLKVETTLENLAELYRDSQPTILAIDEAATRMPRLNESDGVAAERYVCMRRVHSHEDRPYCVIDIYLDAAIFARRWRAFAATRHSAAAGDAFGADRHRAADADDLDRRSRGRPPSRHQRQRTGAECGASSPGRRGASSTSARSPIAATTAVEMDLMGRGQAQRTGPRASRTREAARTRRRRGFPSPNAASPRRVTRTSCWSQLEGRRA
jgi:DNA-binding transcriptional regulator YhcF (GntR family)